jgi:hypothetical protein
MPSRYCSSKIISTERLRLKVLVPTAGETGVGIVEKGEEYDLGACRLARVQKEHSFVDNLLSESGTAFMPVSATQVPTSEIHADSSSSDMLCSII